MLVNEISIGINQLSLAELEPGKEARILSLGKGRGFRARMLGLGIRPGALVSVVSGSGNGSRVVQIGRQQIMLGHGMVSHIFITEDVYANN
ncbi:MAG: ferrous iron transport protein A [Spirochaetia bacterium]